jgi:hypothetical protein
MNLGRRQWRSIAKYIVLGLFSNKVSEKPAVSVYMAAKAMSRIKEAFTG